MQKTKINYQNYDQVIKEAFSIFDDKVLEFLGLKLPRIKAFMETEFAEIETKKEIMDLNFFLEDHTILHIEEEVDVSKEDLIRFASYHLKLYSRYKTEITTLVVCINEPKIKNTIIDTKYFKYHILTIDMSKKNGDKKIKKLKQKIAHKEEVNELELIFLPLMKTKQSKIDILKEVVELEKDLKYNANMIEKIIAMTLVIADKLVERKEIEKIWEEISMLKVIEYAEEKGMEKGIEKGREEELLETVMIQLKKKFNMGILPIELSKKLQEAPMIQLKGIRDNIFDIEILEDILTYLK